MKPSCLSLILCLIFFSQLTVIHAQQVFACYKCIDTHGNYTSTSTYGRNLNTLLTNITTNTQIDNGFYEVSVGQDPDKVYGIAVCRGDASVSDCYSCLADAVKRLPIECPTEKEAIGYYFSEAIGYYFGHCMFRYSDRPIFGTKELSPNCTLQNPYRIPSSDAVKFNQNLANLFDGLRISASAGNARYKYATGFKNVTESLQVYGLMQCNPDLTHSDCSDCLQAGIRQLESCCNTKVGAGIYGPSCGVEYGNYPFFNLLSTNSPPPSSSLSPSGLTDSKPGKGWEKHKTWIVVGVVLFVLMLLATLIWWLYLRRKRKIQKEVEKKVQISCVDSVQFDYSTIQAATDNFSNAKRLGKGTPTRVYKGVLPNQQEIAVKRLSNNGRYTELEFNNEVSLLTDLQHRNLVKLLGSCVEKDSRLLIYEYLPNESLDFFLNDDTKRAKLDWETRHKIILGIARGVLYLHEDSQLRVIHRDLKPGNILLDVEMNPKISNFSKASLVQADQSRGDSSIVLGTYGYMPPEYVEQGHFSVKSDVFSFGVLLLELICGQLIGSFWDREKGESLPTFVWRKWFEGKALEAVDATLSSIEVHMTQIIRCINISLLCVQEDPTCRPTMSTVVFMLNNILVNLAEPLRPAFVFLSYMDESSSSSQLHRSYNATVNGVSITELDPR